MTREKFIGEMHRYRVPSYSYLYADELEARIAELEAPKNCEGCKWFTLKGRTCSQLEDAIFPNYYVHDDSGFYIENYEIEDKNFYCSRYEPKEIE